MERPAAAGRGATGRFARAVDAGVLSAVRMASTVWEAVEPPRTVRRAPRTRDRLARLARLVRRGRRRLHL